MELLYWKSASALMNLVRLASEQSSRDVHAKVDGLEVSVIQAEQKLEARVASLEKGLNARFDELVAHLRTHGIATGVDEDSEGSAIPGAVNV